MHPADRHPAPAAHRRRTAVTTLAVTAATALLATAGAPATAAPSARTSDRAARDAPVHYVALGDSFSSGPGIPEQTDAACGRSLRNYPALVAAALPVASFADATCAGADTRHMTAAQGSAPPQLDALRPDTTLVTLGIGGNDLDLPGVLTRCVLLGRLAPLGAPCKRSYTLLGTDEIGARIGATAPKVAAVLAAIQARSPQARVLVVGYPAIVPDDGTSCRPVVPFADGDFAWFRDKQKQLNTMLAQQAAGRGGTYVDAYAPSVGHDACKPQGVRWIEPEETAEAAGFHPNAAGHRSTADAALATLNG
ncbi:SGNH/GDSL hydrolase family protein [Streptomyces microflavus]|uniref:SGNH/GDSL hydrolase family protein n=1 Tax=Streptomyces TaxID=1883 RepID=UPI002E0F0027|nr:MULTISPECIES: SGNH/GDSL hydrolase family protein [Streptomyces]MEE1732968.1 SGNH/GDSL hydrolase family protein [Streptomyces sp. BE282]WSR89573.1 SGNH/GDSL hydrolase family protein [Streptomyces microflavus]